MYVIPQAEIYILQALALRLAELTEWPANHQKAQMWSQLTDLDTAVRPMLLTHLWPLAWSQVLPDESTLLCQHETARRYERDLRQRIWTVTNLQDVTVVEPIIRYPHCVTIQPYGGLTVKKIYAADDYTQIGVAIFLPEIH